MKKVQKEKQHVCSRCGKMIEGDYQEIDGEIVCQDCIEEYYFYCEDCNKIEERDNGYWIEDSQKLVCSDCIDDYDCCERCGSYFSRTTYVNGYGYVCDDCFDRGDFGYCEGCDEYYCMDDLYYSERNDCYYCNSCWDEYGGDYDGLLYEYHDFDDWHLYKGANEETPNYYIGKEIELEPKNYSNVESVVDTMNEYLNAVGMEDGSLDSGGVEVVTHPESWEYLQTKKEDYKKFFEKMEELKYGDAGNTGLHFHITRPNENVVSRIIVLLESFKEEIQKLSRRNGDFHWSKFLSDGESDEVEKLKYQSTKYLKDKYINSYHDRYVALNLCNTRTIEFRFFNGANNFEEFWGDMQFIHNLMEIALDESRDLNTISWNELIYGEELVEQARKQGVLGINKKAKDTSEIVIKLEKLKEDTKEEIRNTLKNFIRYMTRQLEDKRLDIINRSDIDSIEATGRDFITGLQCDLNYLHSVIQLYKSVDYQTIKNLKQTYTNIKEENKEDKYNNYFEQIDKTFNTFESEVNR